MRNENVKWLAINAMVAAVYAVWTIALAPISYGNIQFRLSEMMVLLAFVNRKYIPGLVIGCFLANMLSPIGYLDVIFGTLATWLAVELVARTKNIWIASLWPTLVNAIVIGILLNVQADIPLWIAMAEVGFGEFVVVTVVGVALFKGVILKHSKIRPLVTNLKAD